MHFNDLLTAAASHLGWTVEIMESGLGMAPRAAGYDKGFLNEVQGAFGHVHMDQSALAYLGIIFGTIAVVICLYLLRYHFKWFKYHLLAMFAGKGRLEDNRRILRYLAKANSALEVHRGDGKHMRFLCEGRVGEVGPAEFVLQVPSAVSARHYPVGKMLTLYFRPIQFKGRQYNVFNTYLERVSQPSSKEDRLHFHLPMSIAYQRRRNHARYEIERQSLVKGKLWLGSWADGRSTLHFHGPSLQINMDGAEDAWVHDISAGGIRLVLPGARATAFKLGAHANLKLFLFNPAKGNYRWIWLGVTVTKVFSSGQGINVCMRFAALGSMVNREERTMRWTEIGVAEGLPGMNSVIGEWREYLESRSESSREALA